VNPEKYFPLQIYSGLFKDFAEGLQTNDIDMLVDITEPHFLYYKLAPNLELIHNSLKTDSLELKIEYNKKHSDETTVFLYNIDSYFIVGSKEIGGRNSYMATMDRTYFRKNQSHFNIEPD
jgi:hypothetical protein